MRWESRAIEILNRNRKSNFCPQALQFGKNCCAHRVQRPRKHRFTWLFCKNMTKKWFPKFRFSDPRFMKLLWKSCVRRSQPACKTLTLDHTHNIPISRSRDLIGQPLYDDEIVSLYLISWSIEWEGHVTSSTSCMYSGSLITRANYLYERPISRPKLWHRIEGQVFDQYSNFTSISLRYMVDSTSHSTWRQLGWNDDNNTPIAMTQPCGIKNTRKRGR